MPLSQLHLLPTLCQYPEETVVHTCLFRQHLGLLDCRQKRETKWVMGEWYFCSVKGSTITGCAWFDHSVIKYNKLELEIIFIVALILQYNLYSDKDTFY